tara:strand:+ start:416 stop:634 length:219 start_codon:yes stop_codon:yes gene_type:complete
MKSIGTQIYYLFDNKVKCGYVLSSVQVENHPSFTNKLVFEPFGKTRIAYATIDGIVDDKDTFETKQALLNSL